jgi:hypothetical protein
MMQGKEADRLRQAYSGDAATRWLHWGPYLSERQWGTVREDYSAGGNAWDYFSHDQARSRAYRWGEDGLAGLSDGQQLLCFALAMWNGKDPIIKERLFGLTNNEGNHGEDVKEYYYYLDNTPTHSYMKWLYKYPQAAYPYADLVQENARRRFSDPHAMEYELIDTGVFGGNRYFDVQVEYAKLSPSDITIKIRATNHGPDSALLHLLPTLWFRNTWSWYLNPPRPKLTGKASQGPAGIATIQATPASGTTGPEPMTLYCLGSDELYFVENETNNRRLWNSPGPDFPKDGINDHLLSGASTVNPALTGTKGSAVYHLSIGSQQTAEIRLRLTADGALTDPFGADFDSVFQARIAEANEFYADIGPAGLSDDRKAIQRQAYAGMLWSKQFYHYIVLDWLAGDPAGPPPPETRTRNAGWTHVYSAGILSMPDVWEYPWFAAWDLCFQAVVFARLDLQFAKNQLLILAREWYMSPAGQAPAYEWAFSDVNPPLQAWAALRIFAIEKEITGGPGDTDFLSDIFKYGLLYYTWWTNRKDSDQNNIFQGGFLGLDNISIIDRSNLDSLKQQLGTDVDLYQSDGTSWAGLLTLNLMEIAAILSGTNAPTAAVAGPGRPEYIRLADKFFQQFVFIAEAINGVEVMTGVHLWDETDGFYYDMLRVFPNRYYSVKLRSLVGIITLLPVALMDVAAVHNLPGVAMLHDRMEWFEAHHPALLSHADFKTIDGKEMRLLSFVGRDQLKRILTRVFNETEFLSPHGIRGISREYLSNPYQLHLNGATLTEQYEPAESSNGLFGGNSNWRGPVWFPINFLLIEALRSYHHFWGDDFKIDYPAGSGNQLTLNQIADDLARRMVSIFERGADGKRPVFGGNQTFQLDPNWKDLLFFYEYFHGDNGAGIGASHQTGWTGLVAELLRIQ